MSENLQCCDKGDDRINEVIEESPKNQNDVDNATIEVNVVSTAVNVCTPVDDKTSDLAKELPTIQNDVHGASTVENNSLSEPENISTPVVEAMSNLNNAQSDVAEGSQLAINIKVEEHDADSDNAHDASTQSGGNLANIGSAAEDNITPGIIKIINMRGELFVCAKCHYKTIHKRYYSHHSSVCQQQLAPNNMQPNTPLVLATSLPNNISYVSPKNLFSIQTPQLLNTNLKILPVTTYPTVRLISPKNIHIRTTADIISGASKVKVAPVSLAPTLQVTSRALLNTSNLILPKSVTPNFIATSQATSSVGVKQVSPVVNYVMSNLAGIPGMSINNTSQTSPRPTPKGNQKGNQRAKRLTTQPSKKRKCNPKKGAAGKVSTPPIKQNPYKCVNCAYQTENEVFLQQHIQSAHLPVYTCNYCSYKINDQYAIKHHLEYDCKNRPPKIFTCTVCNSIMSDMADITNHFSKFHPEYKPGSYPLRQGYLPSGKVPDQPIYQTSNDSGVSCPYCSVHATSTTLLDAHIKAAHPQHVPRMSGSQNNFSFKIITSSANTSCQQPVQTACQQQQPPPTNVQTVCQQQQPPPTNVQTACQQQQPPPTNVQTACQQQQPPPNNLLPSALDTGDVTVSCPTCFIRVPTLEVLEVHIRNSHNSPTKLAREDVKCPSCGVQFMSLPSLEAHVKTAHPTSVNAGPSFSGFNSKSNPAPLDSTTPSKQKIDLKSKKTNNFNPSKFQSLEFNTFDQECRLGSFVTKTVPHGRPRAESKVKNSNVSTNLQRKMDSIKKSTMPKNHECQFCDFKTTTAFNLNRHKKKRHPEMVEVAPKPNIISRPKKSVSTNGVKIKACTTHAAARVEFHLLQPNHNFQVNNRANVGRTATPFVGTENYNIQVTADQNDGVAPFINHTQNNIPTFSSSQSNNISFNRTASDNVESVSQVSQVLHLDSAQPFPNIPVIRDKL